MFRKVLVANRGEIAVRIIRACRELGIATVVAYSEADRDSLPVRLADEAVCIGPAHSSKSYLSVPSVISAAQIAGADAIHPGYGYLAENTFVAEVCQQYGLTFVGPGQDALELAGDKAATRRAMRAAGLPVLPGSDGPLADLAEAQSVAAELGYPLMLKAVAGGGGRGLRLLENERDLVRVFPVAHAEAEAAFGAGQLYLEKYVTRARHVEVQVVLDQYGHGIHLGERDCSVQRRHQKLIEEAPCPVLSADARARLGDLAVRGALSIGYSNVGTLEFLLVDEREYYFIEMNGRLQVEHPVTEQVTGIDIVKWQLRLAAGDHLSLRQSDVALRGHAIECRVTAEDADRDFAADAGTIDEYLPPGGPGIRVDSHLFAGYHVPAFYDSLLSKVIAWGEDRTEALRRLERALGEYTITGVKTSIPFHRRVLRDSRFRRGDVWTGFVGELMNTRPAPVGVE